MALSDGGAFTNTFVGTPRMSTVWISNIPSEVSTTENIGSTDQALGVFRRILGPAG
jgi:hypothetical protein